ncbi:uncharacterized protein LOC143224061 [Tachypleus tridentatus]|uniref:uncharacterized protein LOC143224061 n=1 Tax=Tachypleus tridentatus TaxID=6853 RepID=UPI003FCFD033
MGTTAARPGLLDKELCQMECLENVTYTTCNTVNYFISPFAFESGTKLQRITLRGVAYDVSCYEKVVQNKKVFNYCETVCRQPCRKIIYETKQKRSYWNLVKEESRDKDVRDWIYMLNTTMNWTLSKEFIDTQLLFVSIQSGNSEHLVYKYVPRFQTLEIISYFGSILGLWIGYSIVRIGGIMAILMLRLGDKIKVYMKDKDIMKPIRRVVTFISAYLFSEERS